MKIWKYRTREPKGNLLGNDWENGHVNAETFDEAVEKVKEHIKDSKLALVIAGINLETEVDIE